MHPSTSVKTLGLYASFECDSCGFCCRAGWRIPVERDVHAKALEMLRTQPHPGRVTAEDAFVPYEEPTEQAWVWLAQRDDEACVFLDDDNKCYWHRYFGFETKGWVCRAYPNTSIATPSGTLVDGCLSCPTMGDTMKEGFAGPMGLIDAPPEIFSSALERPRWILPPGSVVPFGQNRTLSASALLPLLGNLLEFPQVEGAPLGLRLLMGRLFLQQLIDASSDRIDADLVRTHFQTLEEDGTGLYIQALQISRDAHQPELLARTVRSLMARMAKVGMPARQAHRFEQVIETLRMNGPIHACATHINRLHLQRFAPALDALSGLLAGYACHRLVRLQATRRGGVLAGYAEALFAMLLVWAFSLATASARGRIIDVDIVTEAIQEVEMTFFHTPEFQDFFSPQAGLSTIYTTQAAALMGSPFVPTPAHLENAQRISYKTI